MIRKILAFVIGFSLATLGAYQSHDVYAQDTNNLREPAMTPIEFMREYERVSAAHDLEGTLDLIDDNAVYFFSNETSHIGKPQIGQAIERNFDAIKLEVYEIRDLECQLETSEAAVCIYEYHWSGEVGGTAMSGGGRGTSVLRRAGESWKVTHEHLSRGPFRR
jgi:ketosteroid isomerase-like protein